MAAGEFKAKCLKLMDRVNETHETVTITKRGVPVAKLVPVSETKNGNIFGSLQDCIAYEGDMASGEHYLLDTHAWVWLMDGKKELEGSPLIQVLEAASEESRLSVASISMWEIAILESKERIGFRIPCLQWILNALKMPGLSLVPISAEIAADSAHLPGDFHGDPADRLIVASARHIGGTILD